MWVFVEFFVCPECGGKDEKRGLLSAGWICGWVGYALKVKMARSGDGDCVHVAVMLYAVRKTQWIIRSNCEQEAFFFSLTCWLAWYGRREREGSLRDKDRMVLMLMLMLMRILRS